MSDPPRPRLEYSGIGEKLREALKDPETRERFASQGNAFAGALQTAREARRRAEAEEEAALVEVVAEAIYRASAGFEDDAEFEKVFGFKRKLWKTDAPWDTNPEELAEHERDDYRTMARAAIKALRDAV